MIDHITLESEKAGVKPYALLKEALKKSKKVVIGSFVIRNLNILELLNPMERCLF